MTTFPLDERSLDSEDTLALARTGAGSMGRGSFGRRRTLRNLLISLIATGLIAVLFTPLRERL